MYRMVDISMVKGVTDIQVAGLFGDENRNVNEWVNIFNFFFKF